MAAIPAKFREFFKQRTGYDWPSYGMDDPPGTLWVVLINDVQADYMDMIAAKVFGEDLEDGV